MTRMRLFHRIALAVALIVAAIAPARAQSLSPGVRSILFGSGCPSAVRIGGACPSVSADFTKQSYWAQGYQPISSLLSVSRASSHLCQYASGVWISVGANVPCITDQGFLIEEARTNKSTNFNANPPALVAMGTAAAFNAAVANMTAGGDAAGLFGVVDDSAAISAIGLQNISNGRVYKIDNTTGSVAATMNVGGATANTNPHTFSAYVRSGNGGNAVIRTSTLAGSVITTSATYSRLVSANVTPANSSVVLQFAVVAGAVGYMAVDQLEEGAFSTSPIVIAGASATRAADVPQLIGPAATAALAAKSAFFQTLGVAGGSFNSLLIYSGGALIRFGISTSVQVGNGTQTATATIGASATYAGNIKSAAGFDAASMTSVSNGGTQAVSANAWSTGTGTVDLGSRAAGDRALNGYMQRFALSPSKGVFDGATAP